MTCGGGELRITLSWTGINRILGSLFALLTAAGLLSEAARHGGGLSELAAFANLSEEGNLPTWYASMLLLACSALLFAIARAERRDRGYWLGLAAAFLYISADELAVIHENLNEPLRQAFGLDGALYFGWILPFGALAAALGLFYLRFLGRLPATVRLLFVTAGLVYVAGAAGTELPVGAWYARHGGDNLVYGLLNLWQEALEILGLSIFCSGLFAYIGLRPGPGTDEILQSN